MPYLPCNCGNLLKYELPDKNKAYKIKCSKCNEEYWVTSTMTVLPRLCCISCGKFFLPKIDCDTGRVKIPKLCPNRNCRRPWNRLVNTQMGRPRKTPLPLHLSQIALASVKTTVQ